MPNSFVKDLYELSLKEFYDRYGGRPDDSDHKLLKARAAAAPRSSLLAAKWSLASAYVQYDFPLGMVYTRLVIALTGTGSFNVATNDDEILSVDFSSSGVTEIVLGDMEQPVSGSFDSLILTDVTGTPGIYYAAYGYTPA